MLLTRDFFLANHVCRSDFPGEDNIIFKFSFICLPSQLPIELKVFELQL